MNLELVKNIADAVLYEGYMLYPYRASSVKNRQRFNWGALAPQSYSAANKGFEPFEMQTECLIEGDEKTTIKIKARFLHLLNREIGALEEPLDELPENFKDFRLVSYLDIGGQLFQTWQEAVEREVDLPAVNLTNTSETQQFSFPSKRELEPLRGENGKIVGVIIRSHKSISGETQLQINELPETPADGFPQNQKNSLFKITVNIRNLTAFENAGERSREEALLHSTVSTHTILSAERGEFVSLLDPPDVLREMAAGCQNVKTYPVLVGEEGEKHCMLSSPIILYDYPQIAPESAGDLFDGTEIDEILTLRIMTLTDEEKREMRGLDDHARKILERTEMMPDDQLLKMHGTLRSLRKGS